MLTKAQYRKYLQQAHGVLAEINNGTYVNEFDIFFTEPEDLSDAKRRVLDEIAKYRHLIYRCKLQKGLKSKRKRY